MAVTTTHDATALLRARTTKTASADARAVRRLTTTMAGSGLLAASVPSYAKDVVVGDAADYAALIGFDITISSGLTGQLIDATSYDGFTVELTIDIGEAVSGSVALRHFGRIHKADASLLSGIQKAHQAAASLRARTSIEHDAEALLLAPFTGDPPPVEDWTTGFNGPWWYWNGDFSARQAVPDGLIDVVGGWLAIPIDGDLSAPYVGNWTDLYSGSATGPDYLTLYDITDTYTAVELEIDDIPSDPYGTAFRIDFGFSPSTPGYAEIDLKSPGVGQPLDLVGYDFNDGTTFTLASPYDPVAHRWLRIGLNGGDGTYDVSDDGVTWVNLHTQAVTEAFVDCNFYVGGYVTTAALGGDPTPVAKYRHLGPA